MLCDAIEGGDLAAVRRLVEEGAGVDEIDFDHEATPIEKAAALRNAAAVRLLLELGAAPNGAMITPALLAASINGDAEIVELLLERGANPDEPDEDGFSPLMAAAWKGHRAIVERLLAGGADPHHRARDGDSAYDCAASDEIRALLPPD